MKTRNALAALVGLLAGFWLLPDDRVLAQKPPQTVADSPNAPFELRNGDRVVFLGNSLFENDFQYNYLEYALTTRWADRDVTFRNLGWSGDNVFGEARSTFTNPPTPYQHLMNQITQAKPTVVFLAYGGVEAEWGEAGLPRFREGLTKLLDTLDRLGARSVLLSPIPMLAGDSAQHIAKRNAMLEVYASVLAETASARGKRYIDLFKPVAELGKKVTITENGIHLNETGYYELAKLLEQSLGLTPSGETAQITITKNGAEASAPVKMQTTGPENPVLRFTMDEPYLPLPPPASNPEVAEGVRTLKISGLKKGFYTLTADDATVVMASAQQWAEGVPIRQGPVFEQARHLRYLMLKKNELFFFQYRPLNQTYILGFRSYEQGRHVKGLEEQNILIKWLEGQIALSCKPKTSVYQLIPLK
ncbi:GDSL-type esterase/lipase family protein [Larkinella sp. VNQ87]|uniref:GDSL-type esterase/lipase family protein n=1 Tax=Larkinella sp. VNQ87 TaxID=3400921 RepID=UPI003C056B1C